jgi:hypothetical protein
MYRPELKDDGKSTASFLSVYVGCPGGHLDRFSPIVSATTILG